MPGYVERNGILHFKELANKLIYDLMRFGFVLKASNTKAANSVIKYIPYSLAGDVRTTSAAVPPVTVIAPTYTFAATLEAGASVDPLAATQPWRIRIDADCDYSYLYSAAPPDTKCVVTATDPGFMRVFIAPPLQLPDAGASDSGKVIRESDGVNSRFPRLSGELTCGHLTTVGAWGGGIDGTTNGDNTIPFVSAKFADRKPTTTWNYGALEAHPYSYMLSVSDRGLSLVIWQEASDDYGDRFSWLVAQRPVDPATGTTLGKGASAKTSKCPVFCIYSIGGGEPSDTLPPNALYDPTSTGGDIYSNLISWTNPLTQVKESPYDVPAIYRFTVRESDVLRPTSPVLATVDSPDNRAVINGKQQVAISEDNKFVIFYPNGFNTDRYMYREEVDTLVYTSADVISQWQEVELMPYAKADGGSPRTYKACPANLSNNRGMRVLLMVEQADVIVRDADRSKWIDPAIDTSVLPAENI